MTEEELMNKMRGSAEEYLKLIRNRQYVRAVNLYNKVMAVTRQVRHLCMSHSTGERVTRERE